MIEGFEGESRTYLDDIELIPGQRRPSGLLYVKPIGAKSASAQAMLIEDGTEPDSNLHLHYPIYRFEITLPGHGKLVGWATSDSRTHSLIGDMFRKKYGHTLDQWDFTTNHFIEELRPFKTYHEYQDWFQIKYGSYLEIYKFDFPWASLSEAEIIRVRNVFTDLLVEYCLSFAAFYPPAKQEPVPPQYQGHYLNAFLDFMPKELPETYWIRVRKRPMNK
ncbi:hypothetical protein [Frigidibacter sp. SD6-1]|uniref:hypothetical protein n=1 Tax=Frigidibacter sp. SD6-1 TaxID=3032581 RepID=UPI0024DFD989|nr:hypothetical protein [Frigidibacter sp. SD6-1]